VVQTSTDKSDTLPSVLTHIELSNPPE